MTLLLDADARLFVIPEESGEPVTRRGESDSIPAVNRGDTPRASHSAAAVPAARGTDGPPASHGAAAPVLTAAELAPAAVPEPATWAGANGQGRSLDDLLSETWEGLSTGAAPTACPVCDGELVRRWSAGAGVVGGRCRDCGSELS
jgi:hypothetical protein